MMLAELCLIAYFQPQLVSLRTDQSRPLRNWPHRDPTCYYHILAIPKLQWQVLAGRQAWLLYRV